MLAHMSAITPRRASSQLLMTAASLIAVLAFAPGAEASPCPGSDACPWTQVDTFGDVGERRVRAPLGIGVDGAGNLYVAEEDTYRIQKLDPSGGFLAMWSAKSTAEGEVSSPEGIAVDAGHRQCRTSADNQPPDREVRHQRELHLGVGLGRDRRHRRLPGLHERVPRRHLGQRVRRVRQPARDRNRRRSRVRGGPGQQAHPEVRPRRVLAWPSGRSPAASGRNEMTAAAGKVYVTTAFECPVALRHERGPGQLLGRRRRDRLVRARARASSTTPRASPRTPPASTWRTAKTTASRSST